MSMPSWMRKELFIDPMFKLESLSSPTSFDESVLSTLDLPDAGPFGNCNTILLSNGRRLLYVRSFGYSLSMDGVRPPKGTHDWLFFVGNADFSKMKRLTIVSPDIDSHRIEDIRLYLHKGTLKAVGTYISTATPLQKVHSAEVVVLNVAINEGTIHLKFIYRSSQDEKFLPSEWQKNWMPICGKEDTFIQKIVPGLIYTYTPETNTLMSHPFSTGLGLSGGPPLIDYNGSYLMLCHRKDFDNYASMLIELTPSLVMSRHSEWFKFSHYLIEFCTCMRILRPGFLTFLYTLMDQQSRTIEVPVEELLIRTDVIAK